MVQSISTFFDQAESQRIAAFESKNKSVDPTFLKDTTQYPLEIEKFLFKDFIKYEFNMDFKLHVQVCHKNQGNLSSGQNPKKQRALDELVGELRLKVSICKRKDRKEYFSICLADNGNVALKFQKQGKCYKLHCMLTMQC